MIESAADTINEVVVVTEVEVEVSNEEEKIDEKGKEKDTPDIIIEEGMMIENERSVVIDPAVDPCQEVAHHHRRRRHRCHHVLPLETGLGEDAIVTVDTANEGTKVKAIERNEGSHRNVIIGQGGNGLDLCLPRHLLLTMMWTVSKTDLFHRQCSIEEKKKGLLTDDSMNQSQNDSFYAFQKPRKTDGEKQRKGKKSAILMESSHLTPLSEKSKSSHANDMKLKEESVASKNLSKNIEKEESIKVQTIDSKAIRLRNIRQKRKTNVVFQSMEDTHKPQKRVSYHQKLQNTLQNPEFLK